MDEDTTYSTKEISKRDEMDVLGKSDKPLECMTSPVEET
jgi:hypothetical protein